MVEVKIPGNLPFTPKVNVLSNAGGFQLNQWDPVAQSRGEGIDQGR